LRRADLLTALGEFVPFENGDLVRELLDNGLVAAAFSAHGVDLGQQLSNCAARARSCSGVIWSRLGEEVMPWILPKQRH